MNAKHYYKYLRLTCTARYGNYNNQQWVGVGELEYWGYEEGDESVDVVHKSIPNKPGQQHLAVYWDANDTSSYSGSGSTTVTDLSGNGVTGTITGNNGFDAEYNAWVFDGDGDYIESTLPSTFVDDQVHTFSLWFKRTSNIDEVLFSIAPTAGETSNNNKVIQMRLNDSSAYSLTYIFWSNDVRYNPELVDGMWYHLCGTYSGGGGTSDNKLLYLNGSLIQVISTYGTPSGLDIDASSTLRLGSRVNHSSMYYFDGSIANFRLFNRALTSDEVWQLYAYQKEYFNVSPDVVTFKGGRLGIGTTEPRAVLDVRGDMIIRGSLSFGVFGLGGTTHDHNGYRVHAFTTSGVFTALAPMNVDILLVGGGGGGGNDNGGGGGAGGLVFIPNYSILSGTHVVTIGSGGIGSNDQQTVAATPGGNTSMGTLQALGGGRGLNGDAGTGTTNQDGGSGGGGEGEGSNSTGRGSATQTNNAFGDSRSPYGHGNRSGAGGGNSGGGGGGGGAGDEGSSGVSGTSGNGGAGGDGLYEVTYVETTYNFAEMFGVSYGEILSGEAWFAGGGAGGNANGITSTISGGKGGGADVISGTVRDGQANTGGGGSGLTWSISGESKGGDGGSGILLLRYKI
jgi:hypothetical protein